MAQTPPPRTHICSFTEGYCQKCQSERHQLFECIDTLKKYIKYYDDELKYVKKELENSREQHSLTRLKLDYAEHSREQLVRERTSLENVLEIANQQQTATSKLLAVTLSLVDRDMLTSEDSHAVIQRMDGLVDVITMPIENSNRMNDFSLTDLFIE